MLSCTPTVSINTPNTCYLKNRIRYMCTSFFETISPVMPDCVENQCCHTNEIVYLESVYDILKNALEGISSDICFPVTI